MVSGGRIVGLAAILGLLGSGVAGMALADVQPESVAVRHPSVGGPLRLWGPAQAMAPAVAGLRLLRQAAAACCSNCRPTTAAVAWAGPASTSGPLAVGCLTAVDSGCTSAWASPATPDPSRPSIAARPAIRQPDTIR